MISLKRNNKGHLVEAKGKRQRANTIYTPGQNDDFSLSRSKFDDFMNCKKCFYLNWKSEEKLYKTNQKI